ncbi:hypothetical protein KR054_002154, partial [Drosophila jambulina]
VGFVTGNTRVNCIFCLLAICELQPFQEGEEGSFMACFAAHRVFSYNQFANECSPWTYGGCGANENIFDSKEECEAKCLE